MGIAQAIIHRPDFVVLDEPTNGLDPNQILEVRKLIKEIVEDRTIVLSTHILSEVHETCDYIRMIEKGKVVFAGTMTEFDTYIMPNTLIAVLAAAPPADDIAALEGVVGVEELGEAKYRIKFDDVTETTSKIVETSVLKNWQLMEIQPEKSSLNTIFAELSGK